MKKLMIVLVVAGVLGGTGYFVWHRRAAAAATQTVQTATAKAERGAIRLSVSSTGRVVANLDVEIKCKASGEVVKLPFDVSDPVKKGKDLLIELDPIDMERALKQSQVSLLASQAKREIAKQNLVVAEQALVTDRRRADAALRSANEGKRSAEARADDARKKAGRTEELLKKNLTSPEESETARTAATQAEADVELAKVAVDLAKVRFDELKTQDQALELRRQDVRLAEAQVTSDQVALDIAQQRLEDTKVLAPIDGVVTARNVQVGQIISSGISNVGGGTTAMTVSDLSRIFVLAAVDESDIGKVTVGQTVTITVDAFAGRRFPGNVVRIASKGVNVSNVVTFEVKIEVLGPQKSLLKPEMTANVEILAAENDDALVVPADSILRKAGHPVVTVVKGGANEERQVETGISDGFKTEIVSGLSEGETVIVHKGEASSRFAGQPRAPNPARMLGGGRR